MDGIDSHSKDFKSYQQVSKTWSRFITGGLALAILLGIASLVVGIIAIQKADDDDITVPTTSVPQSNAAVEVTSQQVGAYSPREDEDSNSAESLAPPGSRNYTGYKSPPGSRAIKTFDVIIHGHVSESYYSVLQKGIDHAARTLRVNVNYFDPETPEETTDHEKIVEKIVQARESLSDGLAVSFLEHTTSIGKALRETSFDIPVMSLLLDQDVYDGITINTFSNIGFSNNLAGYLAGEKFQEAGVDKALCLLNDRSIFGQQAACTSFFGKLQLEKNTTRVTDFNDREFIQETISGSIKNDGIRGILTVGEETFDAAYAYLRGNDLLCSQDKTVNNSNCVLLAAIGENDAILRGVVEKSVSVALSSQQYLQGFFAIHFLLLKTTFQLDPSPLNVTLTGPVAIDTPEEALRRLKRNFMEDKTIDDKRAEDLDIRFIVHGKVSDPFWNEVKSGIRIASRELGAKIDFRHPDSELTSMDQIINSHIEMINQAAEDNVDALILTLPVNSSELRDACQNFVDKTNSPIFTITNGHRYYETFPVKAHIGSSDYFEGFSVRDRVKNIGVSKVLCVNYEKGNEDLDSRCKSLESDEVTVEVLDSFDDQDFHADMAERNKVIRNAVTSYLTENEDVDAVVSIGTLSTEGIHEALEEMGSFCGTERTSSDNETACVEFIAYDLSPEVFSYIKHGEMNFAVDDQPTLQGILAVYYAVFEVLWANSPLAVTITGPLYVDESNAEKEELFYSFLS